MMALLESMGLSYIYEHPVRSGFILDFAFIESKKAIEVDGFYHQFSGKKDRFRDYILRRGGWRILRIPADDLMNAEKVKTEVWDFLSA